MESPPRPGRACSLSGFTPRPHCQTRVPPPSSWSGGGAAGQRCMESQVTPGTLSKCSAEKGSCGGFGKVYFSVQPLKKGVPMSPVVARLGQTQAQSSSNRGHQVERRSALHSGEGRGSLFGHGRCRVTLQPRRCPRPAVSTAWVLPSARGRPCREHCPLRPRKAAFPEPLPERPAHPGTHTGQLLTEHSPGPGPSSRSLLWALGALGPPPALAAGPGLVRSLPNGQRPGLADAVSPGRPMWRPRFGHATPVSHGRCWKLLVEQVRH